MELQAIQGNIVRLWQKNKQETSLGLIPNKRGKKGERWEKKPMLAAERVSRSEAVTSESDNLCYISRTHGRKEE